MALITLPRFSDLPGELWHCITKDLDFKSIFRLASTCKTLLSFIQTNKSIDRRISVFIQNKITENPVIPLLIKVTGNKETLKELHAILHPTTKAAKKIILTQLSEYPTPVTGGGEVYKGIIRLMCDVQDNFKKFKISLASRQ